MLNLFIINDYIYILTGYQHYGKTIAGENTLNVMIIKLKLYNCFVCSTFSKLTLFHFMWLRQSKDLWFKIGFNLKK